MTRDEEKGYLFYIFRISGSNGHYYKAVDPKCYSEESLKKFASKYAKDGILYKTEKECQDIIDSLNKDLRATFDFSNVVDTTTNVECGEGHILVSFPSGKTLKLKVDPVYEEVRVIREKKC